MRHHSVEGEVMFFALLVSVAGPLRQKVVMRLVEEDVGIYIGRLLVAFVAFEFNQIHLFRVCFLCLLILIFISTMALITFKL